MNRINDFLLKNWQLGLGSEGMESDYFCKNLLLRYIYLQFMPPLDSATPMNAGKVRTHRTTLYMKSSYLLASNTPTGSYLAGGHAKTASHFKFWPFTLCAFIDNFMILCPAELRHYASFIASPTRWWQTILPLLFSSRGPQRGKGVYKRD